MRNFLRFFVLPFAVFVFIANLKDIGRYIKIKNM